MRSLLFSTLISFTAFSLLTLYSTRAAAQSTEPGLYASSSATRVEPPPDPPGLGEVVEQLSEAISGKQWSLALSLLVVALVVVLRKAASAAGNRGNGALSRALLWLGTPKGAVALSVVGGTATLLSIALAGDKPLSLSLLLSCFMGAASASGLFSWGQTLSKPRPTAGTVCSPAEIANGTCKV